MEIADGVRVPQIWSSARAKKDRKARPLTDVCLPRPIKQDRRTGVSSFEMQLKHKHSPSNSAGAGADDASVG